MASSAINNPAPVGVPVQSQLEEMKKPFIASATFHLALLLLAIFGLYLFPTKPIEMPTPISISMVKPSDLARTNHVDTPQEEKEKPVDQQPSKAPEPPKPSTPASAPPPPTPTPPVEQKVETPPPPPPPTPVPAPPEKPLPQLAPVPQQQTTFQQPPQLPALQKPQPINKQLPQKPNPKQSKQTDQDFQSLLTNLTPAVPKADIISKDKPTKSTPQAAAQAQMSQQITADEMALVQQRLRECWVPANDIVVYISAQYNKDKTLIPNSLTVLDKDDRYNSDPPYRAQVDSAIRALRNPSCNPLPWPDGKYALWGQAGINFDPTKIFN